MSLAVQRPSAPIREGVRDCTHRTTCPFGTLPAVDHERRYRDGRHPLGRHRAVFDNGDVGGHGEPGLAGLDPDETVQFVRVGYARIDSHADDETVTDYAHPEATHPRGEGSADPGSTSAQQVLVRVGTGIGDDAVLSTQDASVSRTDEPVVGPRNVEFDDGGPVALVLRAGHTRRYDAAPLSSFGRHAGGRLDPPAAS